MSCTNEIDPIITPTDDPTLLKETKGGCFDEQKSTIYDIDTLLLYGKRLFGINH
ncbi:MAG: hypothetical protein PHU27_08770 [Salinivirgaceae bacterium]|nr:hypothetical protein [Salinivirgaceae bacterium]MDD4748138.1 hypothetical protein [Salinivirgaceae bacterium]MDY0279880.1 hypothetical protein [Salinivirgaceae bacterium]